MLTPMWCVQEPIKPFTAQVFADHVNNVVLKDFLDKDAAREVFSAKGRDMQLSGTSLEAFVKRSMFMCELLGPVDKRTAQRWLNRLGFRYNMKLKKVRLHAACK